MLKFRIYSAIYCAILVLFMIFFLVAGFLVGAAGHTPAQDTSDYGIFVYFITTICCLIIYRERQYSILKYINIILVIIPVVLLIYSVFLMFIQDGFNLFLPIITILFSTISLLLIQSIIKN